MAKNYNANSKYRKLALSISKKLHSHFLDLLFRLSPPAPQQAPPGYSAGSPAQGGGYQGTQQANTTIYIQPQQQARTVVVEVKPPNYIVPSVLTMLFCCWIFGLIGLIVGLQVGGRGHSPVRGWRYVDLKDRL